MAWTADGPFCTERWPAERGLQKGEPSHVSRFTKLVEARQPRLGDTAVANKVRQSRPPRVVTTRRSVSLLHLVGSDAHSLPSHSGPSRSSASPSSPSHHHDLTKANQIRGIHGFG